MNFCPICDQKIQSGTWCKNCHRFVKPYEIGKGIRINESHSQTDDADCDYHHTDQEYSSVFTKQDVMHPTNASGSSTARSYTSTYQPVRTSTYTNPGNSGANHNGQTRKTKNPLAAVVIIFVLICWVGGGFYFVLSSFLEGTGMDLSDIKNWFSSEKQDKKEKEEPEKAEAISLEKAGQNIATWRKLCKNIGYSELGNIFPTGYEKYGENMLYFFDSAELLKRVNKCCDESHFSVKLAALESYCKVMVDYDYKKAEGEAAVWNYLYTDGEEGYCVYQTEQSYLMGSTYLTVYTDTVTTQLHSLDLYESDMQSYLERSELLCSLLDKSVVLNRKELEQMAEKLFEGATEEPVSELIAEGDNSYVYCVVYNNEGEVFRYGLQIIAK